MDPDAITTLFDSFRIAIVFGIAIIIAPCLCMLPMLGMEISEHFRRKRDLRKYDELREWLRNFRAKSDRQ